MAACRVRDGEEQGRVSTPRRRGWMDGNLDVQGYCLTPEESHSLRWGLRFPTALCLLLVVTALTLQSAVLILALVPIGVIAGWTRHHPFDLIWNGGVRHLSGAPDLRPNPTPRRHAFKLGAVWLLAVGLLFAVGQPTAAFLLGGVLVAVCGLVTTTNFCIPSTLLGLWWRLRGTPELTTQAN
jgi:Domain of unknown function (DUF4395)